MTTQENRSKAVEDLRQKAEALARERAARTPEDSAALSPEEIRKTLHELRVHQIELEMQNEELRTAQAEIEAGRARYFDLYDLAPVGYCTLSEEGLILEANLTTATLLGTTRGALIKRPISHFILKEDQDIYHLLRKQLFETGEPQKSDLRLVKPDGASLWAHLKATAAQAEDGAPVCRMVISDITERKRSEEALKRFKIISDNAVYGKAIADLQGNILYVNRSFANIHGYEPGELIGKHFSVFHSQEQMEAADRLIAAMMREGHYAPTTVWHRHKDGTEFPMLMAGVLIKDDYGNRQYIAASAIDMTTQHQAAAKLAESETLLSRAQEIAHTGSWKLDLTANRLTWSDEVYRIFGCEPQEFAATYEAFLDFVHPDDRTAVDEAYSRSQREGSDGYEIEHRILRRNSDEVRYVRERCVHERDAAGTIVQSTGMVQDITERKRAEETLREAERNLRSTVDGLSAHIAVLDAQGEIILTNKAYRDFAEQNGVEPGAVSEGINYLAVCDTASGEHSQEAAPFGEGIRDVLSGKLPSFELEYLCHSPDEKRWFIGRVTPFAGEGPRRVIVAHEDITERRQAEEVLRASEEKFRSIFASMTEIVVLHELVCDEDDRPVNYRILDCNPAFTRITGIRREDAVGRLATDVYGSDSAPYLDEYARVALTGAPSTFITAHAPMDKHLDINVASPGKNMFVTVTTDITERKQAEIYREIGREILRVLNEPGELQESIQRVLAALKTRTGVDAVGLRLQKGEDFPYFAQDGFSKVFLRTENTLLERGEDGGVCRNKDGTVRLECTCGLVISGKTDPSNPLFTRGGSCWTNDSFPLLDLPSDQDPRLHPRNNCIHHGYAAVALIPVRTSDRIVGLIQLNAKRKGRFTLEMIEMLEGIAAHIGSAMMRKRAEEVLRESEETHRALVDGLPDVVMRFDREGRHLFVSDNVREVADIEAAQFIGKTHAELGFSEALCRLWEESIQRVFDSSAPFETEFTVEGKTGGTTFDCRLVPERDTQGAVSSVLSISRDITAHREAEQEREQLQSQLNQAQKMESVGRLAGGVAHDFNNMLGVILGHADMILEQMEPDQPFHDDLTEIREAGERSAELTRQLLAFARKQTVAPKVIDLNETLEGMLMMLHRLIGEDIDMAWIPGEKVWPVHMDPTQIDQILANLCVNARDAIEGVGKVTIETDKVSFDEDYCAAHLGFVPGDYVLLAVSDDGCGMDSEMLENVFEPFFTTKESGKGTGLGLATVYGVVKQNNGFINVYSEPGQGTTFRIYLPRHAGKAAETKEPKPKAAERGSETILLVEDEPAILRMATLMLERTGYTVLAAGTPGEAIRLANEYAGVIHLLMTDVVMPEMNGRDLAKNLLSIYPDMRRLFMSGYTANVIAHHGVLDQGVNFIQKPFSKGDLTLKVREVLDQ